MVYKFFDKKLKGSRINEPNYQLANELINQLLTNFKKNRKVYSSFRDNIWVVYLADM